MPYFFLQAFFVYGPYLLEQDDRILGKAELVGRYFDMRRQLCLVYLAGNGRRYNSGAVAVSEVVLHDKYRAYAALLGTHHRA